MKYIDILKLYENKDSRINKLESLTNEQKEEVKAFFRLHNEQESKIDWNRKDLTYDDFKSIMDDFNNRQTISAQKKIANKSGIEGLVEGRDYKYLGEFTTELLGTFRAYIPLSWLGAKTIAGKKVPPINEDKDSAAWCIGYSKTIRHWNDYFHDEGSSFVIICGEDVFTKKMCFEIKKAYDEDSIRDIVCWDYYDNDSLGLDDFYSRIQNSSLEYRHFSYKQEKETTKVLFNLFRKSVSLSNERRPIDLEEQEREEARKKQELEDYKNSLSTINFKFCGSNFPFMQVGTRPEGKVFMSKYLTSWSIPYSPSFGWHESDMCSDWDISMLRQWLNSDEPEGQWYHEPEGVDWTYTESFIQNFPQRTPGFLKLIGLSKSDLNPVTNITYSSENKPIKTVDYVWIPSLSELSTICDHEEGEPLQYWKILLGDNARYEAVENRKMQTCDTKDFNYYSIRSPIYCTSNHINCVDDTGRIDYCLSTDTNRVVVLICPKESYLSANSYIPSK